jgi:hypothetical protein
VQRCRGEDEPGAPRVSVLDDAPAANASATFIRKLLSDDSKSFVFMMFTLRIATRK